MSIGNNRGSITVEASFIVPEIIIVIAAFLLTAMFLCSHTSATAEVRREVLEDYGEKILEGELTDSRTSERIKKSQIGTYGFMSYDEDAEAVFINMPMSLRIGRIFTED